MGVLGVMVEVPRRGEVLRFGTREVERAWAKVDGGGAAGVKAFAVRFADGT